MASLKMSEVKTTSKHSKTLNPGKRLAKLNSIELAADSYSPNAYFLYLNLEGPDLTSQGFEGFFIDKRNESLGRHKGQIGRVNFSQYSYKDKTFADGKSITRDDKIMEAITALAGALGKSKEIAKIDVDDIETLVAEASKILKGSKAIYYIIAGKEYKKAGSSYTNYNLFLPKYSSWSETVFEEANVPESDSKLVEFSRSKHIIKAKPATEIPGFDAPDAIDDFDPDVTSDITTDEGGFATSNDITDDLPF